MPDIIPSLMSPVSAVVASPEPIAPAARELSPAPPIKPPKAEPVKKVLPSALPSKGAKKGRKASG